MRAVSGISNIKTNVPFKKYITKEEPTLKSTPPLLKVLIYFLFSSRSPCFEFHSQQITMTSLLDDVIASTTSSDMMAPFPW